MNKNNEISRKPLNLRERIEIEHEYRYGKSISDIAKLLNRHRSTIYREIDGRPRVGRGNNYVLDINEELYESIYNYIYSCIGSNGKVKKGYIDLRVIRHKRRSKKGFRKAQRADKRANLPSIEQKPKVVDSKGRIEDWEDDLVVSRESKVCIKSVNEKKVE